MRFVQTNNDGQLILQSTYWGSQMECEGFYWLSPNAGAFRLMAPGAQDENIAEMRTAMEVVISRGPWPDRNRDDGIELLFDDHSQSPFALYLAIEQCERLPAAGDAGHQFVFALWTGPTPMKVFECACFYRLVEKIPCLQPWEEK